MRVILDIRISEEWAQREYGSSLGQPMRIMTPTGDKKLDEEAEKKYPPFIRQFKLYSDDPRFEDLKARLLRDENTWPGMLRGAVLIEREYTPQEVAEAKLFHLLFTELFDLESCGEDMGTEYDERSACPTCGAGRIQHSPLRLDLSLAPKEADMAITIAGNEWIVSQRLADIIQTHQITGCHLHEVEHQGRMTPKQPWHQLIVTGSAGHTVDPTRYGIDFLTDDSDGVYTCPGHSLSGLHILSEVFVHRASLDRVDLALTANTIGMRSGPHIPTPLLLVSPRFHEVLSRNRIRGYRCEIAHIVG